MTEPHLYRDSTDRLCFDDFSVEMVDYPAACAAIQAAFDLHRPDPPIINGVDVIFQGYCRGDQIIELAWDNSSGLIVTAKTPGSEPLVREIAAWYRAGG
jgi:hypothetical protein